MQVFDEFDEIIRRANALFDENDRGRLNRNSLRQFMKRRTVVVWPASKGTFKRTRAERIKDTGKTSKSVKRFYGGGKSYRRAKLRVIRKAREKAGNIAPRETAFE